MNRLVLAFAAAAFLPAAAAGVRAGTFRAESATFYTVRDGLPSDDVARVAILDGRVYAFTAKGIARFDGGRWTAVAAAPAGPVPALSGLTGVRQWAEHPDGRAAAAAADGLYLREGAGKWHALQPRDERRSWAPNDVRGVAFDSAGRLWFASPQGAGCFDERWTLYTGPEGLPYDDFTTAAAGGDGRRLADGASFLLPYYMGLYRKFIGE